MTELVQALAEVLGVAPQLLLSTRDFETLIQVKKATSPLPKELSGWRYEIIVAELLESLNTATPPTS